MGYYYIEEPSDYGQDPREALYMAQQRQARMVAEQRRQQHLQMQHRAEMEHRYRAQAEYEHQRRFQHQQQQELMRQAVMRQQAAAMAARREHQRRVQHQRAVEQNMLRQRHLQQQQQAQQAARHHHAEQQWISYVPRFDHEGHHIGWAAKITTGKKPGVQARCGGRVQKFCRPKNEKPKMDFAALLRIAAQAAEEVGSLFSDNGSSDDAAEGSDVTTEGSAEWRKQQEAALRAFEAKAPAHRRAQQAAAFQKYEQANRARKTDEASVGMGLGLGDDAETASQSSHRSDASDQLEQLDHKLDEITSQEMSTTSLSEVEESLTQLLLAADTVAVTSEERAVRKAFVKRVQKQLDAIDTVRASDSESDAEPEAEASEADAFTKAAETETVTVDTSVEAREHSEAAEVVSQALIAAKAKSDESLDEETALLIRAIDTEHKSAAQSAEDGEAELSGALAPEEGDSDQESYDLMSDAE